jgi:hypothetical protein
VGTEKAVERMKRSGSMPMVRRWLYIALLLIANSSVAGAEPNNNLDMIKIISYSSIFEGDGQKGKCRIDLQAWDTALQFVANQSTRLKCTHRAQG